MQDTEPGVATRDAPAPGKGPIPFGSVAELLRRNVDARADEPFVLFGDEVAFTHRDYAEACRRWATVLADLAGTEAPRHVGVLLQNTPTYLAILGGAALAGVTVVGLNDTRHGTELRRDIEHTDCRAVIVEPATAALVADLDLDLDVPVLTTWAFASDAAPEAAARAPAAGSDTDVDALVAAADPVDLETPPPDLATTWCLVLTSGSTSAPKAVICSQRRLLQSGERLRMLIGVTPADTAYVSMPLFHSNSIMVGFLPALIAGASIGLARRFTASGWLPDVRRYGATYWNYTGQPLSYILATPEADDDADNSIRRVFGNEASPESQTRFAARFGCEVVDMFGASEGGVGIIPSPDTPPGALGKPPPNVLVLDQTGTPCPTAEFDEHGRVINLMDCIGEIVNIEGAGPFEGYYRNDEANAVATRFGYYWTGDLGYVDRDGWLYFAGRDESWIRVGGENFTPGPIERVVSRHPDVLVSTVYGVPDADAGDQVVAAIQLGDGAEFDGAGFATWLDAQGDLSATWSPRYVRVSDELPRTATNKVLTRQLRTEGLHLDRIGADEVYVRDRGADAFRPFTADDEAALAAEFAAAGRSRFWER